MPGAKNGKPASQIDHPREKRTGFEPGWLLRSVLFWLIGVAVSSCERKKQPRTNPYGPVYCRFPSRRGGTDTEAVHIDRASSGSAITGTRRQPSVSYGLSHDPYRVSSSARPL